mmetsp:Transcript_29110/g.72733  ORF Transcript_29110/g.72733 Transcript_29110/m.72733 type:complete len:300 (-) Transcript_29110:152-1051(-)
MGKQSETATAATAATVERNEMARPGTKAGESRTEAHGRQGARAIEWDGAGGAAVIAMDAAVFGAERGELLLAWQATCPALAIYIPGLAYSLAHVRGSHIYLGPSGVVPRAARGEEGANLTAQDSEHLEVESVNGTAMHGPKGAATMAATMVKEEGAATMAAGGDMLVDGDGHIDDFFKDALSLALHELLSGDGLDGIVVYVPQPLDPDDEEERGIEAERHAYIEFSLARVVQAALEDAGFEFQEVTTRMARLSGDAGMGGLMSASGECVARFEDDGLDVKMVVPGDASRCLTVASLDLG